MIGLALSSRPLSTSLRIQSLQFTSAPCSNTPRNQFNNFKHAKHVSTPEFIEHTNTKASEYVKHENTPSTRAYQARIARKVCEHASTPFKRLFYYRCF